MRTPEKPQLELVQLPPIVLSFHQDPPVLIQSKLVSSKLLASRLRLRRPRLKSSTQLRLLRKVRRLTSPRPPSLTSWRLDLSSTRWISSASLTVESSLMLRSFQSVKIKSLRSLPRRLRTSLPFPSVPDTLSHLRPRTSLWTPLRILPPLVSQQSTTLNNLVLWKLQQLLRPHQEVVVAEPSPLLQRRRLSRRNPKAMVRCRTWEISSVVTTTEKAVDETFNFWSCLCFPPSGLVYCYWTALKGAYFVFMSLIRKFWSIKQDPQITSNIVY